MKEWMPGPTVLVHPEGAPQIAPDAWVAPGCIVVGRVLVGAASSVWYGSVLRADREEIVVEERVNIQDLSCLHADPGYRVVLEDEVSIGHRAVVHGAHVESGAMIGIGAVILNGARVGSGAIVGAGAVVPPGVRVPAGHLAVGVPARTLREVTVEERAELRATSAAYVAERVRQASAWRLGSSDPEGRRDRWV